MKDNSTDQCMPFWPLEFLSLVRDRRVFFVGDSIMGNLFISLLCALYHTSEAVYRVNFVKLYHCDNVLCPLNEAKHSYNRGGAITFHATNTTLTYTMINSPSKDVAGVLERYGVTSGDILVLNPGLHFNDKDKYRNAMETLKESLQSLKTSTPERFPIIFYNEITPQHFPDMPNGYYAQITENYSGTRICKPFYDPTNSSSVRAAHAQDWRNRIMEDVLASLISKGDVTVIPIASALYDQYDAHLGTSPFYYVPFDCTHWCFPGNVDRYMQLMLFNGILRKLRTIVPNGSKHHVKATDTKQTANSKNSTSATTPIRARPPSTLELEQMLQPAYVNDESWQSALVSSLGLKAGDIIGVKSQRAIYMLDNAGRKCVFNSWDAFVRRGFDVSQVKQLSVDDFVLIPDGPPLE